jgi:hypothetical protein
LTLVNYYGNVFVGLLPNTGFSYTFVKEFGTSQYNTNVVRFSPDGTKIIVAILDSRVALQFFVLDATDGSMISGFEDQNNKFNQVPFKFDID